MNITKAFCLSIALFGASNMQAITNSDFVIQQDNTKINNYQTNRPEAPRPAFMRPLPRLAWKAASSADTRWLARKRPATRVQPTICWKMRTISLPRRRTPRLPTPTVWWRWQRRSVRCPWCWITIVMISLSRRSAICRTSSPPAWSTWNGRQRGCF